MYLINRVRQVVTILVSPQDTALLVHIVARTCPNHVQDVRGDLGNLPVEQQPLFLPLENITMAAGVAYTCAQCLQVLRQRSRLQGLVYARRTAPTWSRSFGSDASNRSLQSAAQQGKKNPRANVPKQSSFAPRAASTAAGASVDTRALLKPNNLFHSFTNSPSPAIRQRAAFIKQNAFCPHPSHQQTRAPASPHDPESRKTEASQPPAHSHFECPDCGVPIYCSEGHWMDDFEAHLEVCETIRQINEDDHDLHSGRFFPEFSYPGLQDENFVINMTNWDTYMFTREFDAINSDRSMRQVTRMLTYPQTIASVLHELSPYNVRGKNRLSPEGLKSLSGTLTPMLGNLFAKRQACIEPESRLLMILPFSSPLFTASSQNRRGH